MNNTLKSDQKRDTQITNELRTEILAEYSALRNEILKRLEIRNQILTFTLIIAGTIFTFGSNNNVTVLVLLIYPLLALCLVLAWMHSDVRAGELGDYIRTNIEKKLEGLEWENYIKKQRSEKPKSLMTRSIEVSAIGVFIITQALALLLAIPKMTTSVQEMLLFIMDVGVIFLTIYFLRSRRRNYARKK